MSAAQQFTALGVQDAGEETSLQINPEAGLTPDGEPSGQVAAGEAVDRIDSLLAAFAQSVPRYLQTQVGNGQAAGQVGPSRPVGPWT